MSKNKTPKPQPLTVQRLLEHIEWAMSNGQLSVNSPVVIEASVYTKPGLRISANRRANDCCVCSPKDEGVPENLRGSQLRIWGVDP